MQGFFRFFSEGDDESALELRGRGHVVIRHELPALGFPAVEQLVGDGLGAPAHVFGDPPHRPSETREEPEPLPVFQLHVLHCCLPFFSFDRRRVADTRPRPFVGMGIVCRISRLSESKLGSPPRGGEREESSFPQQQPIFTRGKLSLKSSLLLEAALKSPFQKKQNTPLRTEGIF